MSIVRNILAVIGLLAVIGAAALYPTYAEYRDKLGRLDPNAIDVYHEMFDKLVETGSMAEATTWKAKVADGLTADDVAQSMRSVAVEVNMRDVGSLPLGQQVEAMTGEGWRVLGIYMYCKPLTAAEMIEYDVAFSAYLPCRVTLVEDETGQLWVYTLNMDLMIYGGREMPPEMKQTAIEVKEKILEIMNRGAEGAF